jgi:hypothetical protein
MVWNIRVTVCQTHRLTLLGVLEQQSQVCIERAIDSSRDSLRA